MSDFDTLESSVESSQPVELYTFALGTTEYLFTSSEDDITFSSKTYEAVEGLTRNEVVQGPDDRSRVLTVTMPANNTFASRYAYIIPSDRASFTLMRLQRNETPSLTSVVLFKGFVKSVLMSDDGRVAKVAVQSLEAASSRSIPRFTFQGMCNHQLYDAACGVNSAAHKFTGLVTAESGSTLTVSGLAASGMDFVGGWCKPSATSDFRMILGQSGDVLTLLLPFVSTMVGLSLDAFEGCDHILTGDCANRFDNVINFGGCAFVPTKNPFATGLD